MRLQNESYSLLVKNEFLFKRLLFAKMVKKELLYNTRNSSGGHIRQPKSESLSNVVRRIEGNPYYKRKQEKKLTGILKMIF